MNNTMTQFCIIKHFDPYGDGKSTRKELKRENFTSTLPIDEVRQKISSYNKKCDYYEEVTLKTKPDGRIREFRDFDTHYYNILNNIL